MKLRITRWKGESPPDREKIEEILIKEGFSPWHWTDTAGTRYDDHTHPHTEVRWVYKGKIRIGADGEIYDLGPGDRLDMPPNTVHWAQVPETGSVSYCCGEK